MAEDETRDTQEPETEPGEGGSAAETDWKAMARKWERLARERLLVDAQRGKSLDDLAPNILMASPEACRSLMQMQASRLLLLWSADGLAAPSGNVRQGQAMPNSHARLSTRLQRVALPLRREASRRGHWRGRHGACCRQLA